MTWSVHATIVSCALAIIGAVAIASAALSNKIDSLADRGDLFVEIHGLHEQMSLVHKSHVDMQASLDHIQKRQADAAAQARLNRR